MSKELKGKNGKIVGSTDYFDELNKKCTLGYLDQTNNITKKIV